MRVFATAAALGLTVTVTAYAANSSDASAPQSGSIICTACHGMHGEGALNGVPRLAGQNADYLSHALDSFKAGTRVSAVMQPIAQNLSEAEIRDLAGYFSQQDAPVASPPASVSRELVMAGKRLAEMGAADVAACFSCHAAQGKGNGARFPSIAGQPAQYVINRLDDFQMRAKGNVPQPGTMTAVAAMLDAKQIEEVAAYLSQLGPDRASIPSSAR
jgi:cytochrome c553